MEPVGREAEHKQNYTNLFLRSFSFLFIFSSLADGEADGEADKEDNEEELTDGSLGKQTIRLSALDLQSVEQK